jgi:hypothetical protein
MVEDIKCEKCSNTYQQSFKINGKNMCWKCTKKIKFHRMNIKYGH